MEKQEDYFGYKMEVLKRLYHRNQNERKPYENIILLTNKQYEYLDQLKIENSKLIVSNDRLQSNVDPGTFQSEKMNTLKRRHSVLQEELAEMHRQNREYAQEVINLRVAVDEKDKEIAEKRNENEKLRESMIASEELLKQVQLKLDDIENQRQFIRDEYESLLNSFVSMEKKMQKLEEATFLNRSKEDDKQEPSEKELILSEKEEELQEELEIAKEVVAIDKYKIDDIVCYDPILPSKGMYKFKAHESEVNAVAWTYSGCKFATAGGDRKVKMWDFTSGQIYLEGIAHDSDSSIFSVDFDTEETLLLAASYDGACRIWTTKDMKRKQILNGHRKKVMSAKFFGKSSKVVSGSYDRTLKIWDLQRRACIRTIFAGSSVNDVVTRYGTSIASGHFDKKIRFWDERCDPCINEILMPGRITSLDLSSDGYSLLSSVRDDDSLQLIDVRMNEVVRVFESDGFLIGSDWTRAKFSPDGEFCVCGSKGGAIYIWVVSTGALKKVLKGHRSSVMACAWSMCGRYLLSCDRNKYVNLRFEF